jgi:predicted nucleic acid-binding protein
MSFSTSASKLLLMSDLLAKRCSPLNVKGHVITSAVCYAEIAGKYLRAQDCAEVLAALSATVSPIDEEEAFLAGQFMREYKLRGGTRTRILADFLIAAHAQLRADRLLTRDDRFFSEAFPQLQAVAPEDL